MKFFTIHVRLTRDCNAHCSYCSSAGMTAGRMAPADFVRAVDFVADELFPRLHVDEASFLTVEYLGGEVLLVPEQELSDCVAYARQRLRPLVRGYRDGAQSNLIATPRRVLALSDLFSGRIGTSWDRHTERRQVAGSSDLYRGLLHRSLSTLESERGLKPGRVIVLDKAMASNLRQEVADALEQRYDLVIRPVFQGGSDDIEPLNVGQMASLMADCYQLWSARPTARIEPFHGLFLKRLRRGEQDRSGSMTAARTAGCPFQSDCAFKSLSIDPDGSLHVCQEMADAGHYPLGNAIEGTFDDATWRLLARRSAKLSSDCARCAWKSECGGGCMNEAIEAHGDPFSKTELCPVWKEIFARIEQDIASGRAAQILKDLA